MSRENGGNGGLIVNISSCVGIDCTQFSTPVYNATKHAVTAFTRSMGVSMRRLAGVFLLFENAFSEMILFQNDFYFAKYGLKFITICPAVTLTSFLENLDGKFRSEEAAAETNKRVANKPRQT